MIEAIAKRKSIRSFADRKVEDENVKLYSVEGIGYPNYLYRLVCNPESAI